MAYRYSYSPVGWLTGLVNFFLGLVEALLALRVILRLFGANPNASFVHWIYSTTASLMVPFRGIFPVAVLSGGYVLDIPAIFAMIIYAVIGYLILALIGWVPSPWTARDDTVVTRRR
jgi:hypothetical protein